MARAVSPSCPTNSTMCISWYGQAAIPKHLTRSTSPGSAQVGQVKMIIQKKKKKKWKVLMLHTVVKTCNKQYTYITTYPLAWGHNPNACTDLRQHASYTTTKWPCLYVCVCIRGTMHACNVHMCLHVEGCFCTHE